MPIFSPDATATPDAAPDTSTAPPFDPSQAAYSVLSGQSQGGPNLPPQQTPMPTLADQSRSLAGKMGAVGHTVLDYFLGPKTQTVIDAQGNPVQQPLPTGQRVGGLVTNAIRGAAAGAAQHGPGATGRAFLAGVQMSDQQREEAANQALRNQSMIRTALDLKSKNIEIGVQKAALVSSLQESKDAGDTEVGRFKTNDDVGKFLNNATPDQSKAHAAGLANSDPTKSYRTYFDPSGSGFIVMQHNKAGDELPIGEGDHPVYQFNVVTDPKTGKQTGSLDVKGQAPADTPTGKYHDWNQQAQAALGKFQLDQANLEEKRSAVGKNPSVDPNAVKTFVTQTLPSYSHIPTPRQQAYRQEAAGVKTQADFEKLQARVDADETRGANLAAAAANRPEKPSDLVIGTLNGRPVAGTMDELKAAGVKNYTKAGPEGEKINNARALTTVFDSSDPDDPGLTQLAAKLDSEGKLGPAVTRFGQWLNQGNTAANFNAGDPDVQRLFTKLGLSTTGLMQVHVGARGSAALLEHFKELADAKAMSSTAFRTALDTENRYVKMKAMRPEDARKFSPGQSQAGVGQGGFNPSALPKAN